MKDMEYKFELHSGSGVIRIVRAKRNPPLFAVTLIALGEEKHVVEKVEKEVLIAWLQSNFNPGRTASGKRIMKLLEQTT